MDTQGLALRLAFVLPQTQRPHDGGDYKLGVVQRREGDEHHAVREEFRGVSRRLYGETGLANAAGSCEREQPTLRSTEQIRYLNQGSLPAHKRSGRCR